MISMRHFKQVLLMVPLLFFTETNYLHSQQQIKIVNVKQTYAIINKGRLDGVKDGDRFTVQTPNRLSQYGEIAVIKTSARISAVKLIIGMAGYTLKVGDVVAISEDIAAEQFLNEAVHLDADYARNNTQDRGTGDTYDEPEAPARAENSSIDVVYLKNGSIIRGTIVELVPDSTIKIRTRDGSIFVYQIDDVKKITKAMAHTRRHNPYMVHRQISRWGLASTIAATLVGSLAMGDEYFATTVIPVVGPFVTIARIENDPHGFYLPGGKPLLIASGVAQTGFLIYFITSWAGGKSYDAKFSVLPSSNSIGLTMRYRF